MFGSAMHGWGFSIQDFSKFVAKRTGASERVLNKTLWGEYYYNVRSRKVCRLRHRGAEAGQQDAKSTMFSQFCLETIRRFYLATGTDENTAQGTGALGSSSVNAGGSGSSTFNAAMLEKMVKQIPELEPLVPRLSKLKPGCVREVLGSWMPISEVLLRHIVRHLPSPVEAAAYRVPPLLDCPLPGPASGPLTVLGTMVGGALGALGNLAAKGVKAALESANSNKPSSTVPAQEPDSESVPGIAVEGGSHGGQCVGTAKGESTVSESETQTGLKTDNEQKASGSGDGGKKAGDATESVSTRQDPPETSSSIGQSVLRADSDGVAVAYLSKYLGADLSRNLLLGDRLVRGEANQDQFVGMLRVFSGTLRPGMTLLQSSLDLSEFAEAGVLR